MTISKSFAAPGQNTAAGTSLDSASFDSTGFTHLVAFAKHEGATDADAVTDNKGSGTFTPLTKQGNGVSDSWGRFHWVKIGTPGSGHVVNLATASRAFRTILVWMVNADSGEIALVDEKTATGSNATPTAGTLSNAGADSIVSFMGAAEYAIEQYTVGSGWSEDHDTNGPNYTYGQSRGAETTTSFSATCTATQTEDWAACAVAFKESSAATAVDTGTATANIVKADVVAGGKTLISTLTGETWVPAGASDLQYAHGAIQWLSADAPGVNYTVSGLSFAPKAIRFYWMGLQNAADAVSEVVNERRGVGFASSISSRRCVGSFSQDTAGTSNCGTVARNDAVACTTDGGGLSDGELDIDQFNSDGFRLVVDDSTPANLTVFWEAWGGDGISAVTIGDIAEPAATGDQSYAATGFLAGGDGQDQVVMLAGVQSVQAVNTAEQGDSGMFVGFSTGTGAQNVVLIGNSDDASTAMDTDGYARGDECLGMIVIAGGTGVNARAALTAFGTDIFTLNWAARATTSRLSIYMAIKGGSWRAGDYTIAGNSGGATATVSGLPFTPKGISLMGKMETENASNSASTNDRMGLGSGSSTSSRRSMGILDETATASSACEINTTIQYDQVLCFPSTGGALQSAYDINAMNSDGFQIIVDTAGGPASEYQAYLAFGNGIPKFDDSRSAQADGLLSDGSETHGWNADVVAALQADLSVIVRTSDTVRTITLPAVAAYNITAPETIEDTIPGTALAGGSPIVATPTFTVDVAAAEPRRVPVRNVSQAVNRASTY